MRNILLLFVLLTAVSCTTQREIERICGSGICISEQITIRDTSYIEKYDTIYRMSAWDSIYFMSSLDPAKTDTIIIEDKYWKGQFIVSNSNFRAVVSHLQDSITHITKTVETVGNTTTIQTVEVDKLVDVPIRDKRFRIYRAVTFIFLLLIIFYIIYRYQKIKLYFVRKFL